MRLAVRFHYLEFEFAPAFNTKDAWDGGSQTQVRSRSANSAAVKLPDSNQSHRTTWDVRVTGLWEDAVLSVMAEAGSGCDDG